MNSKPESSAATDTPAALPQKPSAMTPTGERRWNPNLVHVPHETKQGVLRTSDGTTYIRNQRTGAIRLGRPKVRGKRARKAERVARRLARGDC